MKKMSARERYAKIKARQAEAELSKPIGDERIFDFEAPSGMPFKLRRPNIAQFLNMGTLPMALSASKENAGAAFASLSPDKQLRLIEQSASIVRYICVSPKIVDDPKGDDEIAPEDVSLEDFNALVGWSSGGAEAERLETFRAK